MNAKEGIIYFANKNNETLNKDEIIINKNDRGDVFLYWTKNDYCYRYEGKKTWFTWKGFNSICNTPEIVKDLYAKVSTS